MTILWPYLIFSISILFFILQKCDSGATNAKSTELCGDRGFYCRNNSKCVARRYRCPARRGDHFKKAYSLCSHQEHCQPADTEFSVLSPLLANRRYPKFSNFTSRYGVGNRFYILTAFSPIYRTGSRSRRGLVDDVWKTLIKDPWMHSFVQFRGIVYEFGTYGVHELDINDPNYKYNREWSTGWSRVGTSSCKYRHLKTFMKMWKSKRSVYSWYSNNCHSFTKSLVEYLKDDCKNLTRIIPGR